MKRENMKPNIKTISENLSAKPSKTSRAFSTKCILWSLCFAFGSCLLFGIVLVVYNNFLLSKNVDLENNSDITRDPVLNTRNGSIVDMLNVNKGKIALNTSAYDLPSDIRSSGRFDTYNTIFNSK